MKSFRVLLVVALVGSLLTYSGCKKKDDPQPSPQDAQLVKLSKTWKFKSVTLDGVAQTGYTNFQLTVSGSAGQTSFGYTSSGRPALSPWATSGTFTYGTDFATQLTRDDALPITYSLSDTQLQMTFNYSGNGFSRVDNVKGNWIFTLIP
jgi:hypothetical protein